MVWGGSYPMVLPHCSSRENRCYLCGVNFHWYLDLDFFPIAHCVADSCKSLFKCVQYCFVFILMFRVLVLYILDVLIRVFETAPSISGIPSISNVCRLINGELIFPAITIMVVCTVRAAFDISTVAFPSTGNSSFSAVSLVFLSLS